MKTNQVYGGRCGELLATFDHESSSWKTLQTSFGWAESTSLEVLPKSGMTVNGRLYPLVSLERHISESVGFVLPTPMRHDSKDNPSTPTSWKRHSSMSVEIAMAMGVTMDEAIGKQLRIHPHFVEWMMGFPIGWLD